MFLRHLEKTTDNIITRVITISRVKVSIHLPVTAGEIGWGIWRFPCPFVITAQTYLFPVNLGSHDIAGKTDGSDTK